VQGRDASPVKLLTGLQLRPAVVHMSCIPHWADVLAPLPARMPPALSLCWVLTRLAHRLVTQTHVWCGLTCCPCRDTAVRFPVQMTQASTFILRFFTQSIDGLGSYQNEVRTRVTMQTSDAEVGAEQWLAGVALTVEVLPSGGCASLLTLVSHVCCR
jgi:hypothetical protein